MKLKILISSSIPNCDNYIAAVAAAGGLPRPVYCPAPDAAGWDGLVLCGGDDIDPARFGQENCGSQGINPRRDEAELALVRAFLAAGTPILGICRGHQVLNVALGGSLIQDLAPELLPFHAHGPEEPDRVHPIRTAQDSRLREIYGPCAQVNSYHHQALDRLGEGLAATAWSEGGLVEAVELPRRPVLGVQFHPERMTGAQARPDTVDGAAVFTWFLARCREARTQSATL